MTENILQDIKGSNTIIKWFGHWPDFHDAEVLGLHLDRQGVSWIKIYAWNMTDRVDEKGTYIHEKHATVSFFFDEIIDLQLDDFSPQNVINKLGILRNGNGIRLTISPCYGLNGFLQGVMSRIELSPGERND